MPIMAKEKGGDFKLCPAGTHVGICNLIADLGLQKTFYGPKHKVYIRFEIPDERVQYVKDGKDVDGPMSVGLPVSPSLSKKATLRSLLESWRGREFTKEELEGFDLFKVLGAPCQVVVIHQKADNGNTYANIKALVPLPKGMAKPTSEIGLIKYSPDEPAQLEQLPEWLRTKIAEQITETPEDEPHTESKADGLDGFEDSTIPF